MRLMAGCCIVKLATVSSFASFVTADQIVLLGSLVHVSLLNASKLVFLVYFWNIARVFRMIYGLSVKDSFVNSQNI